ncbi:TadE family type IV pilus minor pilin [Thalassiella azotivora]
MRAPAAGRRGGDRGSVTAELAVATVAAVLLLGALLGCAVAAVGHVRAVDAAAAGARAAARGEGPAEVAARARHLAGPGARVRVTRASADVVVDVRVPVRLPLPGSPGVTVGGSSRVPVEPHLGAP